MRLLNFPKIARRHKKITTGLIVLLIIAWYFGYKSLDEKGNDISYVTSPVEKGMLIVSASGSGQVSTANQVDIKPKVSGKVVYLGVKNGQEIKSGTLLVQIDNHEAQKTVRDAETALETTRLELEELMKPVDALSLLQAENGLNQAKRDLEELIEPPDTYSLMQAENSLAQAKDNLTKLKLTQEINYQKALEAKQKAEDNLEKVYEDSFNTVADAFLDLSTIITGLRNILYSEEIGESEVTIYRNLNMSTFVNSLLTADYEDRYKLEKFIESADNDYKTARTKYDENFENYKNISRYSNKEIIVALLGETLETTKATAEAVKSETNMLDYWIDCRFRNDLPIFSKVTEYQADLKSSTSKTNSHLSSLLAIQRTIKDNKETKLNAERDLKEMEQNNPFELAAAENTIKEKEESLVKLKAGPSAKEIAAAQEKAKEKEESLVKLKAGPDDLEVRSKKIAIQQKQDALLAAQQNLADYFIRAPFDGIITNVDVGKGDSVSSATVIGSLITTQKIAEITLNEIDAVGVKIGQRATLEFDAIEDLAITGQVAEVDTLGTVTQGVVSYNVKISFDVEDERIKPGMSLSAIIVTEAKPDVLLAPLAAIKTSSENSYAEVLVDGQVQRKTVTTGSSNDTMIEIVEGLKEGEEIITQTISNGTTQSSGNRAQGFQAGPDSGDAMKGMFRIMR